MFDLFDGKFRSKFPIAKVPMFSLVLTFNLANSKQEELAKASQKLMCLGLTGVNGCEGLTVCSIVSVWDPLGADPEGCVIKKESVVTECLWSVFVKLYNLWCM